MKLNQYGTHYHLEIYVEGYLEESLDQRTKPTDEEIASLIIKIFKNNVYQIHRDSFIKYYLDTKLHSLTINLDVNGHIVNSESLELDETN